MMYSYHEYKRIYDLLCSLQKFKIISCIDSQYTRKPNDNELWYQITIEMENKNES